MQTVNHVENDHQFLDRLQRTADGGGYMDLSRVEVERLSELAGTRWVKGVLDPDYIRIYHVEVWKVIAIARGRAPKPLLEFEIPGCWVNSFLAGDEAPRLLSVDTGPHHFAEVIPAAVIRTLEGADALIAKVGQLKANSPRYLVKVQVFENPLRPQVDAPNACTCWDDGVMSVRGQGCPVHPARTAQLNTEE